MAGVHLPPRPGRQAGSQLFVKEDRGLGFSVNGWRSFLRTPVSLVSVTSISHTPHYFLGLRGADGAMYFAQFCLLVVDHRRPRSQSCTLDFAHGAAHHALHRSDGDWEAKELVPHGPVLLVAVRVRTDGCDDKDWVFDRSREVQADPHGASRLMGENLKSSLITFGLTIQEILALHGENPLIDEELTFGIFSHSGRSQKRSCARSRLRLRPTSG